MRNSIATRCINSFAINENDQSEIVTVISNSHDYDTRVSWLDQVMQAVKNLSKQQNEGTAYFHRFEKF